MIELLTLIGLYLVFDGIMHIFWFSEQPLYPNQALRIVRIAFGFFLLGTLSMVKIIGLLLLLDTIYSIYKFKAQDFMPYQATRLIRGLIGLYLLGVLT